MESPESIQHSIYAGCHIVPGLEGLLIEEYAGPSQPAYVVIYGLVDNQVPCQYIKSLFLLQNWLGILNLRASFNMSFHLEPVHLLVHLVVVSEIMKYS